MADVKEAIVRGRPIDTIIIHCSDSPDDRIKVDVDEIRRWHLQRGFLDVGYHFVIKKDGTIQPGRSVDKVGAHCEGHNLFSVGICWVGRDDCNPSQRHALRTLIISLLEKYKLSVSSVKGHHEFNPSKTCPNINMDDLRSELTGNK